jgi:hypothetical protein
MKTYKNEYEEWYDMQFEKQDKFEEAYRKVYLKIMESYGFALTAKSSSCFYAYKWISEIF